MVMQSCNHLATIPFCQYEVETILVGPYVHGEWLWHGTSILNTENMVINLWISEANYNKCSIPISIGDFEVKPAVLVKSVLVKIIIV